jgi:hypothetical protein
MKKSKYIILGIVAIIVIVALYLLLGDMGSNTQIPSPPQFPE